MSQSAKRTYRWLGALALAHALLVSLLIICFFDAFHQPSLARCWFALATLWFLSPIVLILHRGRSWRGCFGFFVGSTLLLLPSFTEYFVGTGPWVLGLPPAVELEPISVSQYCRAWWAGRVQAKSDVAEGILAREVYGFGGGGPAAEILRKRYNIQTRALAGCIVDAKIVGHAAGYNAVSNAEIERRVGRARIKAAEAEGLAVALGTNERRKSYCEYLQNVSQSFQATRT